MSYVTCRSALGWVWEAHSPGWGPSSLISRHIGSLEHTFSFAETTGAAMLWLLFALPRWRTSSIMQWKMLLAPSRLMNPNWHGRRSGEIADSPVKQVFHSHKQGTAGFSAGAEVLHLESVWSVLQTPATLFYAASTLKAVTQESRTVHTVSDSKPRVPHSHPVVFGTEWPEHRWAFLKSYDLGFVETRNVGTPFFFFFFFFFSRA